MLYKFPMTKKNLHFKTQLYVTIICNFVDFFSGDTNIKKATDFLKKLSFLKIRRRKGKIDLYLIKQIKHSVYIKIILIVVI